MWLNINSTAFIKPGFKGGTRQGKDETVAGFKGGTRQGKDKSKGEKEEHDFRKTSFPNPNTSTVVANEEKVSKTNNNY